MVDVKEFVRAYGYWAVFFGSLVEGEGIILIASAFAAMGILNIYKIATIAFLGTLVADQLLFLVGHRYGNTFLGWLGKKYPSSLPYLEKAEKMVNRFDTAYILIFRFIYGIRTISPIVIGSHHVPFKKFAILNFVAALIWASISCAAGYYLGEWFEEQGVIIQILSVALISMVFGGWVVWKMLRQKKTKSAPNPKADLLSSQDLKGQSLPCDEGSTEEPTESEMKLEDEGSAKMGRSPLEGYDQSDLDLITDEAPGEANEDAKDNDNNEGDGDDGRGPTSTKQ